jgi:hypothetical protein
MIAKCLRSLSVKPVDTRDERGAERFHAFAPGVVLNFKTKNADAKVGSMQPTHGSGSRYVRPR